MMTLGDVQGPNVALLVGLTNLGTCMNLLGKNGSCGCHRLDQDLGRNKVREATTQVKRGEHIEAIPSTKVY